MTLNTLGVMVVFWLVFYCLMPMSTISSLSVSWSHLQRIAQIRSFLLVALWVAFGIGQSLTELGDARMSLASVLTLFTLYQIACVARLRTQLPVVETEFFVQLLLDVAFLNAIFYCSGGASNPFVSYLLVPVCISAATLPWRYTWIISALCILAYSLLLFFYKPLAIFSVDHSQHIHSQMNHAQINWHILGMWFNFFISAILITYFVVKMAQTIREQQGDLNRLREDELRHEQVIAVATLAAGAAHEINTPLSTMKLLLSELEIEHADNKNLAADLHLLKQQVNHCAGILKQLVQDSAAQSQGQAPQKPLQDYVTHILDRWQLLRPHVTYQLIFNAEWASTSVAFDSRIDMAIINLLTNAADANPQNVIVDITVQGNKIIWKISDQGDGISPEQLAALGQGQVNSTSGGLGLGLLLSHTSLKHFGGEVIQSPNSPKGTITEIRLPLA